MKFSNDRHFSHHSAPPPGAWIWLHAAGLLTGGGDCRYAFAPANHVGPHLILSGRGVLRCQGREQEVAAGDMFCLYPDITYEYFEDPEHPWRYAWLHLEGPGAVAFAEACGFPRAYPVRRFCDFQRTAQALEALRRALEPPEANPYETVSLLYAFAQACQPDTTSPYPIAGMDAGLLHRALLIVDSSLHTGLNVTELAAALGIGRTKLFLAFREGLGTTPVAYLADARIKRAEQLLSTLDLSVTEVASATGFRSPKYFARCFRENTGMSPTQWRDRRHA